MHRTEDGQGRENGLLGALWPQRSLVLGHGYAAPDAGQGIAPSPWFESTDPSFTPSQASSEDSDLKDRRATLTWCTVLAVLGIALVSVIGSLLVNASWSLDGDAFWATQPLLADEQDDENREALVAAREMVRHAARPMTVNFSLIRTTKRLQSSRKTTRSVRTRRAATLRRLHRQPLSTIGTNHVCGRSFYTYCTVLHEEAYYSPRERRCLLTTADAVRVCNRSPNRFASLDACYNSCGRMHGPMADRCFEKTLFTDCERQDVWSSWWVFSGRDCVQWSFPRGLCPDDDDENSDVAVFANRSTCVDRCLSSPEQGKGSTSKNSRAKKPCRQPRAKSCTAEHLRFPYFADILESGRGHCVVASAETLLMHRCLIGANRFKTVNVCREACEQRNT